MPSASSGRISAIARDGFKFVRQMPIGPFIADFACREADLIVELDGGQHAEGRVATTSRTDVSGEQGYRVIRFWNNDVLAHMRWRHGGHRADAGEAPSPGLALRASRPSPAEARMVPTEIRGRNMTIIKNGTVVTADLTYKADMPHRRRDHCRDRTEPLRAATRSMPPAATSCRAASIRIPISKCPSWAPTRPMISSAARARR